MHPDLPDIIHRALLADRREPTGLLHCSSHSHWPLRFTQLSQVFPVDETDFGSLMTMGLGTMTHKWLEKYFTEHPEILGDEWVLKQVELNLDIALPLGWTGTLDWLFQHIPTKTYVIGDLKTAKPEALAYLKGKPKSEHTTQVSCYHAGLTCLLRGSVENNPIDPDIFVCYLPKGKTVKQETVLPVVVTAPAEPSAWGNMVGIKRQVDEYVAEFSRTGDPLNKFLAPMPDPELKVYWNKDRSVWDVKEYPHWTETYIGSAWDETLVPRTSTRKIGEWTLDGYWRPRKGVTTNQEIPRPSDEEVSRRRG